MVVNGVICELRLTWLQRLESDREVKVVSLLLFGPSAVPNNSFIPSISLFFQLEQPQITESPSMKHTLRTGNLGLMEMVSLLYSTVLSLTGQIHMPFRWTS